MAALVLAAVAVGCSPHIGDKCSVSTDCSAAGDRLCDITEPGGYCTIFNCEPDSCPDDAECINFGTRLSSIPGCGVSQGNSPYQRSFCLASCESQSDCRSGYSCVEPEVVGGVKADYTRSNMVCAVKPIAAPPMGPPDASTESGAPTESDAATVSDASINLPQVCVGSEAGPPSGAGGESGAADRP